MKIEAVLKEYANNRYYGVELPVDIDERNNIISKFLVNINKITDTPIIKDFTINKKNKNTIEVIIKYCDNEFRSCMTKIHSQATTLLYLPENAAFLDDVHFLKYTGSKITNPIEKHKEYNFYTNYIESVLKGYIIEENDIKINDRNNKFCKFIEAYNKKYPHLQFSPRLINSSRLDGADGSEENVEELLVGLVSNIYSNNVEKFLQENPIPIIYLDDKLMYTLDLDDVILIRENKSSLYYYPMVIKSQDANILIAEKNLIYKEIK